MDQQIINCIYNLTNISDINDFDYNQIDSSINIKSKHNIMFNCDEHILIDEITKILKKYRKFNYITLIIPNIHTPLYFLPYVPFSSITIKYYHQNYYFDLLPIELIGDLLIQLDNVERKRLMLSFLDLQRIFDTVYIKNVINTIFPRINILNSTNVYNYKLLFFELLEIYKHLKFNGKSLYISNIEMIRFRKESTIYFIKENILDKDDTLHLISYHINKSNLDVLNRLIDQKTIVINLPKNKSKLNNAMFSIFTSYDVPIIEKLLKWYHIKISDDVIHLLNKDGSMDIINSLIKYKVI